MSRWDDNLKNHPLKTTLDEVIQFLETKHKDTTVELEDEKRRLIKFFTEVQWLLDNLDAEMTPFNLLDVLNNEIRDENVWNNLSEYATNGDIIYLLTANEHLTPQLQTLMPLLGLVKTPEATKSLKALEKLSTAFITNINTKENALGDQQKASENTTSTLNKRLEELSGLIDAKKTETDNLITEWQKQFSDGQSTRSTDYNTWRKDKEVNTENRVKELILENSKLLTKNFTDFTTKITKYDSEARKKHTDILDLHGIVAGDSVAAGYAKSAKSEGVKAIVWSIVSIVFILAAVICLLISYFWGTTLDIKNLAYWGQALKAFSITGLFLYASVFAAKQSNIHLNSEQRTRWLALEVKAIDPFIASMPPADQSELKKSISTRLFGQMNHQTDKDENVVDGNVLSTIMKSATDLVKAAKG